MAEETRSEANLVEAYHAESRLVRTYLAYARTSEGEGNDQLAKLFRAAAASEKVHAQSILKVLPESAKVLLPREEDIPTESVGGSIAENLRQAIDAETEKFAITFPRLVQQADSDGMHEAREILTKISTVERIHAALFKEALDQLGRNPPSEYNICQRCGNIIERMPKGPCEVCDAPDAAFQQER